MMSYLMNFKSTFFLWFLVTMSCGNVNTIEKEKEDSLNEPLKEILVAANQTSLYLPLLKNKRVGIVANQTSVIFKANNRYTHIVDSLVHVGINVQRIFSPEHGFRGNVDAGEHIKGGEDAGTGISIASLYGKSKKIAPEQLKDLDVLVFDIQDVGVRFYTYTSTLHLVMEACAENNIPLIVLDRPNPNGSYVDGPTLETEHTSFLGKVPIPLVYGMTIGEYAKMLNGEQWLAEKVKCDLTVIALKNYTHQSLYKLPIRPSPNLPNYQAIKLYPSLGLFEGTHVNAGRGTEFQFQRYGAPFLNKTTFDFNYTPQANFGAQKPKHKDVVCYGEDLSNIKAPDAIDLTWLIKAYKGCNDRTQFFKSSSFTLHAGTKKLEEQIIAGETLETIRASWQEDINKFKKIRGKYLLYK